MFGRSGASSRRLDIEDLTRPRSGPNRSIGESHVEGTKGQPWGSDWGVGALEEQTAEARRDAAQTGLAEYLDLSRQLSELGRQEKEIAARKVGVVAEHKNKISKMVKEKILSPGKVYLAGGKAILIVLKKQMASGDEYEAKVMELG